MNDIVQTHKSTNPPFWKGMIIPLLIFVAFMIFFLIGVHNVSSVTKEESGDILQDAVIRATMQCYAIEGLYPPDIKYLEDNYGLTFDQERFIVHYEVFAGNILPDITVIDLEE
ncbi:MAG: hypothetical protein PHW03_04610 [Eubacteriales bacterium]|nr:hypothetical protein [Eubacteriales bacterium]MDD4390064.1 hypothetical protein [Eubacteriales bacterium]